MLWEVRAPLLEEAKRSPALLSDLAGLEQYIAESYDSRSFVELLQNADDAVASRFVIQKFDKSLFVANDGRKFTRSDFESLCRSAASSKSRGTSIGYRGIGFKSVVGFAKTIHLISGELQATFSRELTAREVPDAARVPLVRIPHPLQGGDSVGFKSGVNQLVEDGYTTIFAFDRLLADVIEKEFSAFDPTSLLFLRNVRHVDLRTDTESIINVRRQTVDGRTRSIRLASDGGTSEWTVIDQNDVAIAFRKDRDQLVRLDEREAVVHAYLPTTEPTGLAVKVHADISTDPSRTRVVLDERTAAGIHDIAAIVVNLLDDALSERELADPAGIVAALVPFTDPRIGNLQRRSFKTELFGAMRQLARGRFDNLRYRPPWLNSVDFDLVARASTKRVVPRNMDDIDGLANLLRFLGASEADIEELSSALSNVALTIPGAAEVVGRLIQRHTTNQFDAKQISHMWRLWPINAQVLSLAEATAICKPLDRDFVDLVTEKALDARGLQRLLNGMVGVTTAATLLPEPASTTAVDSARQLLDISTASNTDFAPVLALNLKRWRGAEQQVLQLLSAQGWAVEDVSRQNIGYDIEGRTPEGVPVSIEVKSIDYSGQPFTLTSNEEAVARQKGDSYYLAIVRQDGSFLEVAFIRNPVQELALVRQCRQWVWECSSYAFTPQRFPLE